MQVQLEFSILLLNTNNYSEVIQVRDWKQQFQNI